MAYEMKSFRMWVMYYDVAQELTPKEQGEYYRAIMDYMFQGTDDEGKLSKSARVCFKAVKANLKRSKSNRREVGDESVANRCDLPQTENALNLNLNSNSNPKPSGAGSGGGKPDHRCPKCGGKLWRNTQTGKLECDTCLESFMAGDVA